MNNLKELGVRAWALRNAEKAFVAESGYRYGNCAKSGEDAISGIAGIIVYDEGDADFANAIKRLRWEHRDIVDDIERGAAESVNAAIRAIRPDDSRYYALRHLCIGAEGVKHGKNFNAALAILRGDEKAVEYHAAIDAAIAALADLKYCHKQLRDGRDYVLSDVDFEFPSLVKFLVDEA